MRRSGRVARLTVDPEIVSRVARTPASPCPMMLESAIRALPAWIPSVPAAEVGVLEVATVFAPIARLDVPARRQARDLDLVHERYAVTAAGDREVAALDPRLVQDPKIPAATVAGQLQGRRWRRASAGK